MCIQLCVTYSFSLSFSKNQADRVGHRVLLSLQVGANKICAKPILDTWAEGNSVAPLVTMQVNLRSAVSLGLPTRALEIPSNMGVVLREGRVWRERAQQ